jgi:hypothetical protein
LWGKRKVYRGILSSGDEVKSVFETETKSVVYSPVGAGVRHTIGPGECTTAFL